MPHKFVPNPWVHTFHTVGSVSIPAELSGMTSFATERKFVKAQQVSVSDDSLTVDLSNGCTIVFPIGWFPRLLHGTQEERGNWRLVGKGEGIRWPDLDEDISVENLILGKPPGESQRSLKHWVENRQKSL